MLPEGGTRTWRADPEEIREGGGSVDGLPTPSQPNATTGEFEFCVELNSKLYVSQDNTRYPKQYLNKVLARNRHNFNSARVIKSPYVCAFFKAFNSTNFVKRNCSHLHLPNSVIPTRNKLLHRLPHAPHTKQPTFVTGLCTYTIDSGELLTTFFFYVLAKIKD